MDDFVAGTSEAMANRLIDKWFFGEDLPMPLTSGDAATGRTPITNTFSYSQRYSPLFIEGVDATDIAQGMVGDCYFVATLGAIAQAQPSLITNSFIDNGNGSYGVRFYIGGQAVYTTVNKEVVSQLGSSPSGELWVALMEKAYTQLNTLADINNAGEAWQGTNSYQEIEGGWAWSIKQLTNLNYRYYSSFYGTPDPWHSGYLRNSNPNAYKQTIIDALNNHAIVWLGSFGNTKDQQGKLDFVSGHAFMVLGYDAATDSFIIRNPWGDGGRGYNAQFEARIEEFWNTNVKGTVAISDPTIADPVFSYSIQSSAGSAGQAVLEDGQVTFTITRSGTGAYSTVYLSTTAGTAGNNDFRALPRTALSFLQDETVKTVTVDTYLDDKVEGIEAFTLNLSSSLVSTNPAASASGYIANDAIASYVYSISTDTLSAAEGETITFTITRNGTGVNSSIYLSTDPGSASAADYVALDKLRVDFAAYETVLQVTIPIAEDALGEGTESFTLQLYKYYPDTTPSTETTVSITDSYLPAYEYTVTSNADSLQTALVEGNVATFSIMRSGSGSASTVYVDTALGSAGTHDFVTTASRVPVSFAAHERIATFSVNTQADQWREATEFFALELYEYRNDLTPATYGTAFIRDPVEGDNFQNSFAYNYALSSNAHDASTAVAEGTAVQFTVIRGGSGSASTVYLSTRSSTAGALDYQQLELQAIDFAPYESSKTVTVNTTVDTVAENLESFFLSLYTSLSDAGPSYSAAAYINDAGEPPTDGYHYTLTSNAATTASSVTEGDAVSFTITRSGSGTPSSVLLALSDATTSTSDHGWVNNPISFAAYETSKTILVNTHLDELTESTEYFSLELYKSAEDLLSRKVESHASGFIRDAGPSVYDYTISSSAETSSTAVEEGDGMTFTITRNGSGSASTVYLVGEGGDANASDYGLWWGENSAMGDLTFAPYETTRTITLDTHRDGIIEGTEHFFLNLYKTPDSESVAAYGRGYIQDGPADHYDYNFVWPLVDAPVPKEGDTLVYTIERSGIGSASTVYVRTNKGSADNLDYSSIDWQEIEFAADESEKTVTITTYSDALSEGRENFWLELFESRDGALSTYMNVEIDDSVALDYGYSLTSSAGALETAAAEGGAITFSITRGGSGTESTVYLVTSDGTATRGDYIAIDRQAVSFAADEITKTITVDIPQDRTTEATEHFSLTLFKHRSDANTHDPSGTGYATSPGYISNTAFNDYSYTITSSAASDASAVTEGGSVVFTITRDGSATAATTYLGTSENYSSDYAALSHVPLHFAVGESSKTVSIATHVDKWIEGSESFWLNLYETYADLQANYVSAYAQAHIADIPVTGFNYSLTNESSNPDQAIIEGGTVSLIVRRDGGGTPATVYLSTVADSADSSDFDALDRAVLNFSANEIFKTVTIAVQADGLDEGQEHFRLNLYSDITDISPVASTSVYVLDQSTYSLSGDFGQERPVIEGGVANFTIYRTGQGVTSTIYLSTLPGTADGNDYGALDRTPITFAANETGKRISLAVSADSTVEGSEDFQVAIYTAVDSTNAAAINSVYIQDDYSYALTANDHAIVEGNVVNITISRHGVGNSTTVYLSTAPGSADASDYGNLDRFPVVFDAGETVKTLAVNVHADALAEGSEDFQLLLHNTASDSSAIASTSARIQDDYAYALTSNAGSEASAAFEGGTVVFTITRSGTGSTTGVFLSSTPGSANGADYAGRDKQAVTFADYETSKTISVDVVSDATTEGVEDFQLQLYTQSTDSSAAESSTAYIRDAFTYTLGSNADSAATAAYEGSSATFTITRRGTGSASTVYLSTTPGSAGSDDYVGLNKHSVSFAANETSKTINVDILSDTATEGVEEFQAQLYIQPTPDASAVASVNTYIRDGLTYTYTLGSDSDSAATAAYEGSAATFTITRSDSGTASTVYLSTAPGSAGNDDYASLDKLAVSFAANETSKTVSVDILSDTTSEGVEDFLLQLYHRTEDTAATASVNAYIRDSYTYTLGSDADTSATAAEEGSSVTFTITRSDSGSASTVYLSTTLGSAGSDDYSGLDKLAVSFAANETSKTVSVDILNDSVTENVEDFQLQLYHRDEDITATASVNAYILDKPSYTYTIESNSTDPYYGIQEGQDIVFTIWRSNSQVAETVYISTLPGTANEEDYSSLDKAPLVFAANESYKTVLVSTYYNYDYNYSWPAYESFELALYAQAMDTTPSATGYANIIWSEGGGWGGGGGGFPFGFGMTSNYGTNPSDFSATTLSDEIAPTINILGIADNINTYPRSFPGHSLGAFRNDYAFAALKTDGSIVTWGYAPYGGDSSTVASSINGTTDVLSLYSTRTAFSALREDGSVVTWGNEFAGGNSDTVAIALNGDNNVIDLFSTSAAFSALRVDGSLVTWGSEPLGGNSTAVASQLNGDIDVSTVYSNLSAFAALRSDGSIVTWGYGDHGGNSSAVSAELNGDIDVVRVYSTGSAFAALRSDGSVITWGSQFDGGNSSNINSQLDGSLDVVDIGATTSAFAALRTDGSVISWGYQDFGGDSSSVSLFLDGSRSVTSIASTDFAFAALCTDGSVLTWGYSDFGGNSSSVASLLDGTLDVTQISSNSTAFAALRADGSVVTWGHGAAGGDSSNVTQQLNGDIRVEHIIANEHSFAALREDGSVITWGSHLQGGNNGDDTLLNGAVDVVDIFETGSAYAALRADGLIVAWGDSVYGGDSSTVASQLTTVVNAANLGWTKPQEPTGSVLINGTAKIGQTLHTTHTLEDANGLGTISYQWQADGIDIPGGNGDSLLLGQDIMGRRITVIASYTDGEGTAESVTSAATTPVANVNALPTLTDLPTDITVTAGTTSDVDLSAASFADPDAGTLTLTLAVGAGTLTATASEGVTIDVTGSTTLTLTGTAADIDTYLNTASHIQYTSAGNIHGDNATTLTLTANDGSGETALGSVNLDVASVNHAPTFSVGDGKVTTDFGSSIDFGRSVTLQADGKILVAGTSTSGGNIDFALARYYNNGSLDTSFSSDGILTTSFGSDYDYGYSVTVQDDGRILVAGENWNGSNTDFALARYNSDGSPDTGFSGDGLLTTDFGSSSDYGRSVTVQDNGKILVAGTSRNGNNNDFALVRYNSDGSLDTNFSSDGKVTTDFGSSTDIGSSITLQTDGMILVAGESDRSFALARYNIYGGLDTNLSGDGKVTTNFESNYAHGYSVTVQADGKILVAGDSGGDFALVRYNIHGLLIPGLSTDFWGDGMLTTNFGSGNDLGKSVAIQADGKILVAGYSWNGSDNDFALARYNTDGSLDTSFSGDGLLTTDFDSFSDYGQSITIQADGKILVAGGSNNNFALARYNPDGSLDTHFDAVNGLNGTPTYAEGGSPVRLDEDVQVIDTELTALDGCVGNYAGASLTLARHGGANSEDSFSFNTSGALFTVSDDNLQAGGLTFATYIAGNGTLSINNTSSATPATQALVDDVLRHIAYSNSSDAPPSSVQIDWTFDDGNSGTQGIGGALNVTGSTTVLITPVNEAPTLTDLPTDITVTEDTASDVDLSAAIFADPDSSTLTLTLAVGTGTLTATTSDGVAIDGTGSATLTFTGTAAAIDTYLNTASHIQYTSAANIHGDNATTLTLTANDGSGETALGSVNVDITAVNSAPTGTVTITGQVKEGATLTASHTLTDEDGLGTITWQWQADGIDIPDAHGGSLPLGQDHVGQTITVIANYTDGQGTPESVASTATAPVANINDVPTGTVTLTGQAREGATLTVSHTLADEDSLGVITWQWQADGFDIPNAQGGSLTLGQERVGQTITVIASYTDGQGTPESVTSTATAPVANVNDTPTGTVTLTGQVKEGATLTVSHTLADEDGLGNITWQWQADGSDIPDAQGGSLVLGQDQVGKTITVIASYTDGQGAPESVASTATAPVLNINDAPTGTVSITGQAKEGATLTASHTLADEDGLGDITWQWQADGSDIPGAHGDSLVLGQDQVGKTITVIARYTDGQGTPESVTSSATAPVANVNDAPSGTVTLTGLAKEGATLTASHTLVDEDGLGVITWQWQADGFDIPNAHGDSLTLGQDHVGQTITVIARYTDGQGTPESVVSTATAPVANVNDAPIGTVTLTGLAKEGATLTASHTLADEDGLGDITWQWQADGIDIPDAHGGSLTLGQERVGQTITVIARYTDGQGTPESVTSSATAEVVSKATQSNDTLEATNDTEPLTGGLGDDLYIVLADTNQVIELPGEGNDTVQSPYSWTLGANVENLVLTGSDHRSGTGNHLDNLFAGNTGNNLLDGGVGSDTLAGGLGDDRYVVDNVGDVIQESTGAGNDTILASVSWTLGAHLENLVLTGTRNLRGTGNDLDNHLAGNGGANVLNGGGGADLLDGGSGNDTLAGGAGSDTFAFTTAPHDSRNVDTLTDFTSGSDRIELSSAIFTQIGFLIEPTTDAFFQLGATAQNANDRILYDQAAGSLYYDADGTGAVAAIRFTVLSSLPVLHYTDFIVA